MKEAATRILAMICAMGLVGAAGAQAGDRAGQQPAGAQHEYGTGAGMEGAGAGQDGADDAGKGRGGGTGVQAGDQPATGTGTQPGQHGAQAGMRTGQAIDATPEQIVRNPEQYYGKTVRVRSDVNQVMGAHAFTLDENAWFAGPDILVFVESPAQTATKDQQVTVTGTLKPFKRADMERDYSWFNFDWFRGADYDTEATRPALIAQSVRTADGMELVQARAGTTAGDQPAGMQWPKQKHQTEGKHPGFEAAGDQPAGLEPQAPYQHQPGAGDQPAGMEQRQDYQQPGGQPSGGGGSTY